ncbi:MAG: hypothetical protein LC754_07705 [Acidobacteria bacterium]|nr:hypothetical protein [Acidobacteriota bacterium]
MDGDDDDRCLNRATLHDLFSMTGTDPDDTNPAIRRGSMVCDGPDVVVEIDVPGWVPMRKTVPCPTGTQCVVQPNGTGICIIPPGNYVPQAWVDRRPPLPPFSFFARDYRAPAPNPLLNPSVTTALPATDSVSGDREVALCKSILRSGHVSWGGGTSWTELNINLLCNGTKNGTDTIHCFESNVKQMGWSKAIEKCK